MILTFTCRRKKKKSSTECSQVDTKNKICYLTAFLGKWGDFLWPCGTGPGLVGFSHNPCHEGKSESFQMGPERTTSSQYCASWKTVPVPPPQKKRVQRLQFTPFATYKIVNLPCKWNIKPSQGRVGLSLFPPRRAESMLRAACLKWDRRCLLEIIQVSRNTRLGSYNMWRPAKPAMPFKKSMSSR